MPTTARLFAGLALAALGWVASDMIRPLMPEATNFGWFNYVNAGLGLLCGWVVIGSRLGKGYTDAIGIGLTGVGALVFWGLFAQSANLMLKFSLDKRYEGPMEAFVGLFEIAFDYILVLYHWPLIGLLVAGGVVIGLVSEFIARRWS